MKHYSTITVPATKEHAEIILDGCTCDLCSIEIKKDFNSAEEIKIHHKSGNIFGGGGAGEKTSFGLCSRCFDNKLTPWLKNQGAIPVVAEWEW